MQLEGTVYIESVFVLNLVMNLYLLKLTGKVLQKSTTFLRTFLGSFIGAAGYCMVLCLPELTYTQKIGMGMIPVGILMVKVGLKARGRRELIYGTGWLFTFSFLLGGFMLFLRGKSSFVRKYSQSGLVIAGIGMVGYELIKKGIELYQKKKENHFCKVKLDGDTGEIEMLALVDTGNGLIEPVSKKPVAILEEEQWNKMNKWKQPEKYKLIPYHSIGKEHGLLEGYEVTSMQVEGEMGVRQYEKVIIAVFKGNISKKGGYQMILPPELSI